MQNNFFWINKNSFIKTIISRDEMNANNKLLMITNLKLK